MTKLKLFQDTVCEVMNLAGGKCLVRDSKGEELEVYEYELSPIPLSKELLEQLGFRFDKVDYMIKGWECYKLTKINRVYFTPAIFIESKELTPPIGYVATEDGEQRFSFSLQHRKNFVDNRIGTCWVEDLNEFLNTQFGQEFRTDRCSQSFLKRTSSNPNSRSIITVTANLNLEIKGDLLRYSSISIFDIKCNM